MDLTDSHVTVNTTIRDTSQAYECSCAAQIYVPCGRMYTILRFRQVLCMRQGMFTLSGAPSTTSQIGYSHLVHFTLFGKSSWLMHVDF